MKNKTKNNHKTITTHKEQHMGGQQHKGKHKTTTTREQIKKNIK